MLIRVAVPSVTAPETVLAPPILRSAPALLAEPVPETVNGTVAVIAAAVPSSSSVAPPMTTAPLSAVPRPADEVVSVPAATLRAPEKVFAPRSESWPAPVLVSGPVPPMMPGTARAVPAVATSSTPPEAPRVMPRLTLSVTDVVVALKTPPLSRRLSATAEAGATPREASLALAPLICRTPFRTWMPWLPLRSSVPALRPVRARVPRPCLMSWLTVPAVVMTPESVCALEVEPVRALTVSVRATPEEALQVTGPESVSVLAPNWPSTRDVAALARTTGLVTVMAEELLSAVPEPLTSRLPAPKAPATLRMSPPAWRSTPVEPATPKVFAPPSWRLPAPALARLPVLTAVWMIAAMLSPGA